MKKFLFLLAALILFLNTAIVETKTITENFYSPAMAEESNVPKPISSFAGNFDHKITLVFSDIDGTLIPLVKSGPRGIIPQSVKEAKQKLSQAQIPMILVTGRSCIEATQIAQRMGNGNTYIISQQGAEITNPQGQRIYEDYINNKDCKKIIKEIKYFNKKHSQDTKIFVFYNGIRYSDEKFTMPYNLDEPIALKSFDELGKMNPHYTLSKIGIYEPNPAKIRLIQTHLKKKFPNYHIDLSTDCYCDITTITATKGNAVKKLAQILKTDLKNVAVFGDLENDISMLSLVKANNGLAVAVGNAPDSVKNSGNYVTAPVTEDGFAKAVDEILKNNSLIK